MTEVAAIKGGDQQPRLQRHSLSSLMATVRQEVRAHLKCITCDLVYLPKESKSQCPKCGDHGEPYIIP